MAIPIRNARHIWAKDAWCLKTRRSVVVAFLGGSRQISLPVPPKSHFGGPFNSKPIVERDLRKSHVIGATKLKFPATSGRGAGDAETFPNFRLWQWLYPYRMRVTSGPKMPDVWKPGSVLEEKCYGGWSRLSPDRDAEDAEGVEQRGAPRIEIPKTSRGGVWGGGADEAVWGSVVSFPAGYGAKNEFWCILRLKEPIWWQQIYYFWHYVTQKLP